jgi:hypothetical protein
MTSFSDRSEPGSEFEGDLRAAMQAGCGALSVL